MNVLQFLKLKKFETLIKKYKTYRLRRLHSTVSNTKDFNKRVWKGVVGLEIHAQINTASKLFSGANTSYGAPVNSNVSLFDAAIPGTLPVLNQACVESGVLTALALSCKVNPVSWFDRKHYFYADLPAGYQITQQRAPLANNGILNFHVFTPGVNKKPYTKSSVIQQIQLEQDSGKSLHDDIAQKSLVDLNRAGVPLMELVFAPDLSNGEEAASLVKELSLILSRLGTCLCKMEEGGLRVDVNVSVHCEEEPLGVRSEVKNIGSVRGVAKAVDYEIKRQCEILDSGGRIINETRAWDPQSGTTVPMRDKEETQDYRFMPEPNLPPLRLNMSNELVQGLVNVPEIQNKIPELPAQTRSRLQEHYKLPLTTSVLLVNEDKLLQLFEQIMESNRQRNAITVSNILTIELLTVVNKGIVDIDYELFTAANLGDLVDLLERRQINLVTARRVLEELVTGEETSPSKIVYKHSWTQISDVEEITRICQDCFERNTKLVAQYYKGKQKVFGAFLGDIAQVTDKKVDMETANRIMKQILDKNKPK